jgi:hypothetical protein
VEGARKAYRKGKGGGKGKRKDEITQITSTLPRICMSL